MDNQRRDINWESEFTSGFLGPDEQAMDSVGLTHPEDLELEQIIQQTMEENWTEMPQQSQQAESKLEATQHFPTQKTRKPSKEPASTEKKTAFLEKLRPKDKKGYGMLGIPHILATVIWIVLILAIGISLGRTIWVCAADLLALGKTGQEVTITIDVSDNIPKVAEKLKNAGMIKYPKLFEMFTSLTGKGDNILNGSITFSSEMVYDYNALVNAMSYRGGSLVTVQVMIPEGFSCAQIFALLEEKGVCSAADLEASAANGDLGNYWFLTDIQRGHKYCLEGFLFPDTYEFYRDDEPDRVLEKFLDNFEYRFSTRMIDKLVALKKKTGLNLTLRDIVIMASIVEKEKAADLEGYKIASVFYNRLTHASHYPFLNSDATIKYATDYYNAGELITDAQINDSPYNTYTHQGLPAGPIANPGLSSLDAALDPEDTDYYYFIFDKQAGYHLFSGTLAEHEEKARQLGY